MVMLALTAMAASATVTVRGQLTYRSVDGGQRAIRWAEVVVNNWNLLLPPSEIATGVTDQDGFFTITYTPTGEFGSFESGVVDPQIFVRTRLTGRDDLTPVRVVPPAPLADALMASGPVQDPWNTTVDFGTLIVDSGTTGVYDHEAERCVQAYDFAVDGVVRMQLLGYDRAPLGAWFQTQLNTSTTHTAQFHQPDGSGGVRPFVRLSWWDAGSRTSIYRQLAWTHLWDLTGNSSTGSQVEATSEPIDPFAQLNPSHPASEGIAWSQGYMAFVASHLRDVDTIPIATGPGTSISLNVEQNWDGWDTPNGNADGSSDNNPLRAGFTQPAAIAAFLRDLNDPVDPNNDLYDYAQIGIGAVDNAIANSFPHVSTARRFMDAYEARSGVRRPTVWGQAMTHGMRQTLATRPPIGLTNLVPTRTPPWYWGGPASATMTVRNYGSQPFGATAFTAWNPMSPLTLRMLRPNGTSYAPMLGGTTAPVISTGLSHTIDISVPRFGEGTGFWVAGQYTLRGTASFGGNPEFTLLPAVSGVLNNLPIEVRDDPTAPTLTVDDGFAYTPILQSFLVTVMVNEPESSLRLLEIALGTTPGGTNLAGWRNATIESLGNGNWRHRGYWGGGIPEGTVVYVSARATNANNLTRTATSDGIRIGDVTAPTATVDDQGDDQASLTSVTFRTTASEPEGALWKMESAISSTPGGAPDLAPWRLETTYSLAGLIRTGDETITRGGLNLPNGRPFYVLVRWTNHQGRAVTVISNGKYAASGNVIRGRISLSDLADPTLVARKPIEFALGTVEGPPTTTVTRLPLANGFYAVVSPLSGPVRVSAKGSHFLRRARTVTVASAGVTADFTLINGDVDGDNSVTVFDYDRLSAAFDATSGEPNWDENADLDGDGTVTVFDYDILSNAFDQTGDEP